jgi:hypothetical protein
LFKLPVATAITPLPLPLADLENRLTDYALAEFALDFCLTPLFLVVGVLIIVDVFVSTVRRQVVPVDAVFSHNYLKLIPFPVRSFILPESRTVEVGPPPPLCSFVWIAYHAVTDMILCLRCPDVVLFVAQELRNRVPAPVRDE